MFDTQFLLSKGIEYDIDLYDELVLFWTGLHGPPKRSNLALEADEFFDNAYNGKDGLDHDSMHLMINPIPMYTRILKDGKSVETCQIKFSLLTFEEKCNIVREEVMVMAYERFRTLHHKHAYNKMLEKFTLAHAPEWMVTFIIHNYFELMKPNFNYITRINHGRKNKSSVK
jgi:hypothetical protein